MGIAQNVIAPENLDSGGASSEPGSALPDLVGESTAFRAAVELALRVTEHGNTTVMIQGETGTGKELLARAIHRASANAGEPFVAINCSAIPDNLLESELFGHERGAFTDARTQKRGLLEVAGRGTVLLDEIDELPMSLQPKLLRVLEERRVRRLGGIEEYDVECRVVAATNVPLPQEVDDGAFREDLYYRLNVFRIELPPLRERPGDIEPLVDHFMRSLCRDQGIEPKRFSPAALDVLHSHNWPGNVRELKNLVESTLIVCDGPVVEPEHIRLQRRWMGPAGRDEAEDREVPPIRVPPEGLTMEAAERELVRQTLAHTDGNRSEAARKLGVSRPTVIRKIQKYGLEES